MVIDFRSPCPARRVPVVAIFTRTVFLVLILFLLEVSRAAAGEQKNLRVLTINAWTGLDYVGFMRFGEYETEGRRELRFACLVSQLKALRPDVLFLQGANPVSGFASRLADALGYDEIHQVSSAGIKIGPFGLPTNWKEGLAILALPALRIQKADVWILNGSIGVFGDPLTLHFESSTMALVGRIKIGLTPMYLVNVRFPSPAPAESELVAAQNIVPGREGEPADDTTPAPEWTRLLEEIRSLPTNSPTILAGNFDATPQSGGMRLLQSSGSMRLVRLKRSNSPPCTWDPAANENAAFSTRETDADGEMLSTPERRLLAQHDKQPRLVDHILLSREFRAEDVIGSDIVLDSAVNGVHPSDHYGVMADLVLANATAAAPRETPMVPLPGKTLIEPFPIFSYDPATGWGVGGRGRARDFLHLNESFTLLASGCVRGERVVRGDFSAPDAGLRRRKLYPFAIDFSAGYHLSTGTRFFGVGSHSAFRDGETYSRESIDVSLTASKAFTLSSVGYVGLRYSAARNFHLGDQSQLARLELPGSASRVSSRSCFIGFLYDARDNDVDPSSGMVIQGEEEYAPSAPGNHEFIRLSARYEDYTVLFYPRTVLAIRCAVKGVAGINLPVQLLTPLGGNSTLRGFARERYLDKIAAWFNAELRFPLIWRFGGVIGMDGGRVSGALRNLTLRYWSANSALGLRYVGDSFVLRLDAAFSHEMTGAYLDIGQFF